MPNWLLDATISDVSANAVAENIRQHIDKAILLNIASLRLWALYAQPAAGSTSRNLWQYLDGHRVRDTRNQIKATWRVLLALHQQSIYAGKGYPQAGAVVHTI